MNAKLSKHPCIFLNVIFDKLCTFWLTNSINFIACFMFFRRKTKFFSDFGCLIKGRKQRLIGTSNLQFMYLFIQENMLLNDFLLIPSFDFNFQCYVRRLVKCKLRGNLFPDFWLYPVVMVVLRSVKSETGKSPEGRAWKLASLPLRRVAPKGETELFSCEAWGKFSSLRFPRPEDHHYYRVQPKVIY